MQTAIVYGASLEHAVAPKPSGDGTLRYVQSSYTLQNTRNKAIEKAEFWTYAPARRTASQQCIRLMTSHPSTLIEDEEGNLILHFIFQDMAPFSSKIVMVQADVWVTDLAQGVAKNVENRYLETELNIESNSEKIKNIAKLSDHKDRTKAARMHFDWVTRNISREDYSAKDRGALWAVHNKRGDCTEMAQVFTALCRVSQIPARVMGGYICPNNSNLNANQFHNWAEFFDGLAWQIVDPQSKVFMKKQSDYIATEIVRSNTTHLMGKAHRYRFSGDGLKVKMN